MYLSKLRQKRSNIDELRVRVRRVLYRRLNLSHSQARNGGIASLAE
jgi:hypothetical protein